MLVQNFVWALVWLVLNLREISQITYFRFIRLDFTYSWLNLVLSQHRITGSLLHFRTQISIKLIQLFMDFEVQFAFVIWYASKWNFSQRLFLDSNTILLIPPFGLSHKSLNFWFFIFSYLLLFVYQNRRLILFDLQFVRISNFRQIRVEKAVHIASVKKVWSPWIDLINHEIIKFFRVEIVNDFQKQLFFKFELKWLRQEIWLRSFMWQIDYVQFEESCIWLWVFIICFDEGSDIVHVFLNGFIDVEFPRLRAIRIFNLILVWLRFTGAVREFLGDAYVERKPRFAIPVHSCFAISAAVDWGFVDFRWWIMRLELVLPTFMLCSASL